MEFLGKYGNRHKCTIFFHPTGDISVESVWFKRPRITENLEVLQLQQSKIGGGKSAKKCWSNVKYAAYIFFNNAKINNQGYFWENLLYDIKA